MATSRVLRRTIRFSSPVTSGPFKFHRQNLAARFLHITTPKSSFRGGPVDAPAVPDTCPPIMKRYISGGPIDNPDFIPPEAYDVLLTDITSHALHHEISDQTGYHYLTRPKYGNGPDDYLRHEVPGYIRDKAGSYRVLSTMILSPMNIDKDSVYVHFIIDIGSPWTFISTELQDYIYGKGNPIPSSTNVYLDGHPSLVYCSGEHFKEANVLGADFMIFYRAKLGVDYGARTSRLLIPPRFSKSSARHIEAGAEEERGDVNAGNGVALKGL